MICCILGVFDWMAKPCILSIADIFYSPQAKARPNSPPIIASTTHSSMRVMAQLKLVASMKLTCD